MTATLPARDRRWFWEEDDIVVVRAKHYVGTAHDQNQQVHAGGRGRGRAADGGSPEARALARAFERAARRSKVEVGLIIRPDGTTEEMGSGRETQIELTDAQIASLAGATFTHVHPVNGAPLSWADVAVGIKGGAVEIRAVTKDGWVGVVKAPGGSWDNVDGSWEVEDDAGNLVSRPIKGQQGAYDRAASPRMVWGSMLAQTRESSQKKTNARIHELMQDFAKDTGASYTFTQMDEEPD